MVDERALIRRSRQGDEAAFEQLVALKREKVFRIARNIVGDEDDARDIAQQAFIRLWSVIGRFDENSRFDPWFFRIVVNLAIDFYRKEKRAPIVAAGALDEAGAAEATAGDGMPPVSMLPGADAEVMRAELRMVFNRIAAALTPAQRAAFTLREIEGVATEDIATIMGVRASTVRSHLLQARRVLQDGLRRRYPEYFRGPRR